MMKITEKNNQLNKQTKIQRLKTYNRTDKRDRSQMLRSLFLTHFFFFESNAFFFFGES